jgi:hypothetical protein
MKKIQGQFASRAQAERAVEALRAAGVPAEHVRIWNTIPEGTPGRQSNSGTVGGAVTGAVLGGPGGLVLGAVAGKALDVAYEENRHLPEPSGARVVVDLVATGPDVAEILREHGASNIQ